MGPEEEAIMNDPRRVRVSGPLGAYRDGFAEELARRGYTAGSAQRQVLLLAHLSRWLDSRGLGAADLTPGRVEEFLEVRRAEGYAYELSQRGVLPLLGYLRGLGLAPVPPEAAPGTPAEMLLEEYGNYLAAGRGLAAASIEGYLRAARLFLSECGQPDGPGLACLTAGT
jgi:integrase/recombinase XerD